MMYNNQYKKEQKEVKAEFKTLLTKQEYERIRKTIPGNKGNTQIDYYFDTRFFILNASEIELRVKQKDSLILRLERRKGYNLVRTEVTITEEQFKNFLETGEIPDEKIKNDIADIVKNQKIINFMTLKTYRQTFPYNGNKGRISIDKCEYVDTVDYELEFEAPTRGQGKQDFINIIKEFNITYKKSTLKLNRAYEALRKKL